MNNISLAVNANITLSVKNKLIRRTVLKLLEQIEHGYIVVSDPLGTFAFGNENDNLKSEITIGDLEFYSSVLFKGSIGFANAFLHGQFRTDKLTNLLLIMAKNLAIVEKSESNLLSGLFNFLQSLVYVFSPNNVRNSKQRILEHYDLSNSLFELFLDETMSYSSLMFKNANDSLEDAARNKVLTLLNRLQLKPKDSLLEIGTGWGWLAMTAASDFGCKVTTTTISDKQYAYAKGRIDSLGLNDRITLLNNDYRTLKGKFNKLISVEMIEAVGHQYLKEYFKVCSGLLHDDGLFALQTITIRDQEFERAKNEVDFIKKYIFPGGCLPSTRKILTAVADHTDLTLLSCEDITYDYALTLNKWRERFLTKKQEIHNLGFDNYFIRMWEYYFSYCEAGFLNRNIMCLQLIFAKPGYKDPRHD